MLSSVVAYWELKNREWWEHYYVEQEKAKGTGNSYCLERTKNKKGKEHLVREMFFATIVAWTGNARTTGFSFA